MKLEVIHTYDTSLRVTFSFSLIFQWYQHTKTALNIDYKVLYLYFSTESKVYKTSYRSNVNPEL